MMSGLPSPTDLILVAFMPAPRDMEIARLLGWYRIPLRTAPKVVAVDYLAFYQPASFGEHKWQIETVARVQGHELTTRGELFKDQREHPRAGEEYFKVQLGPLVQLPRPVQAGKWKRVTFLYTTGAHLLGADTINDLTVHDEQRQLLWHALRERALAAQGYRAAELPELPVGPEILALFLGMQGAKEPEVPDDTKEPKEPKELKEPKEPKELKEPREEDER
ncbi:MAG: hypothetical protein OEZ02_11530 [Anaerolineae bacterium]|nr:hypothetical protein [Anaerolineae bacterium]